VGTTIEFPLGPPRSTPFSSLDASVTFSTAKQLNVSVAPMLYGANNAWRIEGRNSFKERTADNVSLGTDSDPDAWPNVNYHSERIFDTFYLRTWRQLYVGVGFAYTRDLDIESADPAAGTFNQSPIYTYSVENGFNSNTQASAGGGFAILFDNRDNPNDAMRGWYASATFNQYFKGFLGGDSDWHEFAADIRTYHAFDAKKRHKIAFWTSGNFVSNGTSPYLALPTTAGDPEGRSTRGYAEGRVRGVGMVYGEVEYRQLVSRNGLIGIVTFLNAATFSDPASSQKLFDSAAVGGGAGVRLLFSKRSRANLCFDVGVGRNGSHGIYLGLNDAF
jgi:outer membrane protein assembly factor BamA